MFKNSFVLTFSLKDFKNTKLNDESLFEAITVFDLNKFDQKVIHYYFILYFWNPSMKMLKQTIKPRNVIIFKWKRFEYQ